MKRGFSELFSFLKTSVTVKIPKLFPSFLKHRSAHKKINDSLMLHHDLIMCIIFLGGVKGERLSHVNHPFCVHVSSSPSPHQNVPRDSEGRNCAAQKEEEGNEQMTIGKKTGLHRTRDKKIRQKFCSTIESC